ncbi:glucose uptake inhibitor SgrT [Kosakonia oryzendophytica]|uniref:glucose uptake inhibitor SgrT n=1 Tax=Kosakonia TaxID=1330547 RepID=UPI000CA10A09|nr:glucose uptake inhibitor SgrT [Kosakonia sp. ML.JS2a]AUP77174.1 glucose uptake inhibitor SgrT [Enterobacter sp. EA-1]UXY10261.1 glucose uptake inhibitor SgrT [Kosakonia sp. ML.JS2a]
MKGSSTRRFYLDYFLATQDACWLACQSARSRLKMLEELMQWDVTTPIRKG